ncbi:zinc metalloprotease [Bacteroidia bacterium]|nr:zinc metalloprotease [Bacteroidia bacterium]
METVLIKVVQLILSLSILVIVHEFGHFILAKIFKVRVEKFYLFFNPWFSLYKFKPKNSETEYGVGWLPLGGYVKISGMIDESMDKEAMAQPPKPWEFRTKPAWQRLLIMVGGVVMNFILSFFIYAMIVFAWGKEYLPIQNAKMGYTYNELTQKAGFRNGDIPLTADGVSLERLDGKTLYALVDAKEVTVLRDGEVVTIQLPADFDKILFEEEPNFELRYPFVVQDVTGSSPAKTAGLQAGDSIVGANGNLTMAASEIQKALADNKSKAITLDVYRSAQLLSVAITPNESGKIGVALKSPYKLYETVRIKYNFFSSFPAGISIGIETISNYLGQFKYLFSKDGAKGLGGFGAIGNLFPPIWSWPDFWSMTAFLSIMLGIMNILPIPALDGGHVLFLIYEVVSRRKPNEKFMEYAQMAGMALLLLLLVYANGNDLFRFLNKG